MIDYTSANSQTEERDDEDDGDGSDPIELAIKLNRESSAYSCAVCGDERTSAEGPELFLADTWELVCDECGRRHAPLLMALIDLGAAAEGYVTVREAVPVKVSAEDLVQ